MATESGSGEMTVEQQVILEVLQFLRAHKRYPTLTELRSPLPYRDAALFALLEVEALREVTSAQGDRVQLTPHGLLKYGAAEATAQIDRLLRILLALDLALTNEPDRAWSSEEIGALAEEPAFEVSLTLTLFVTHLHPKHLESSDPDSELVTSVTFDPQVFIPQQVANYFLQFNETEGLNPPLRLSQLRVNGYRILNHLEAQFEPLTVIIGANGSGKSSLFDLLSFASFAAVNPLPGEVDPRSVGKALVTVHRIGLVEEGSGTT